MLRRPLLLIMPGELTNGQTRSFIELSLTAKRGRTVRFITKEKWKWVSVESPKEYSSSERRREHLEVLASRCGAYAPRQDKAGQCRTGQDRTGHGRAGQY